MATTAKTAKAPRKPRKAPATTETSAAETKATSAVVEAKPAAKSVRAKSISHEEIARLAHRFWIERGRQHGHHQEDWLRAERELGQIAS